MEVAPTLGTPMRDVAVIDQDHDGRGCALNVIEQASNYKDEPWMGPTLQIGLRMFQILHCESLIMRRPKPTEAYRKKLMNEGNRLYDKGDDMGLISKMDEVLATFPDDPEAIDIKAEALMDTGQFELAIPCIERMKETSPPSNKPFIMTALALKLLNRSDDAMEEVLAGLEMFPQDIELLCVAAKTLVDLGRGDEATAYSMKAISLKPRNVDLWLLKASNEMESEMMEEAYGSLDKALELDPRSVPALKAYADLCCMDGDELGQKRYLEMALDIAPDDEEIIMEKAFTDYILGHYGSALNGLRRVSDDDSSPRLRKLLVDCMVAVHDLKGALKECDDILSSHPEEAGIWERKGDVLAIMGRHQEAEQCFDRSIAIDPDSFSSFHDYALSVFKSMQMGKAAPLLEKALEEEPGHPDLLCYLADVYALLGDHASCIKTCDRFLSERDDAEMRIIKARALINDGMPQEALDELEQVLEEHADDAFVLNMAGEALSSLGRKEEAAARYHEAISFFPESVDALSGLGDLTGDADWYHKALEACDILIAEAEEDPSFTLFRKSDVLRKLGQEDEARKAEEAAEEVINRMHDDEPPAP